MKKIKTCAWMMAMAIACVSACSLDEYEQEKPFTTCPVEHVKFFACETNNATTSPNEATATADTIFTEEDIEWLNVTTREIRFKVMNEQLLKKLMANYHQGKIEFHLGENVLFEVSRFVADFDSRVFYDLVLHYSSIGKDEDNPRYYLHDCYPPQFIDNELTQANIKKNAVQWETFIYYLNSIGKLRK